MLQIHCFQRGLRRNVLLALLLAPAAGARGAELRTTLGGQTVRRTVAFEPVAPPPTVDDSIMFAEGESWDVFPDGECRHASCGAQCLQTCGCFWGGIEYLVWWQQGLRTPPLLTTSSPTSQMDAGILGLDTTSIVVGNERIGEVLQPGGRIDLGFWLDRCQLTGIGGRFFMLNSDSANITVTSDEYPILARPFYDVSTGEQSASLISYPESFAGSATVSADSDVFGGDAYLRHAVFRNGCSRVDLVGGYQFSRIDQSLEIVATRVSIGEGGTIPVGTTRDVQDLFTTRNEFHGGMIGLRAERDHGCLTVSALAQVGLGNMHEAVAIRGANTATDPEGGSTSAPVGLLAQPSNIGDYSRDQFVAVPQIGITLAYHVSPCIDLSFGYSFMYWSEIISPGDQIDLGLNLDQLPQNAGPARPAFAYRASDFWVQGVNFGLQCRF